MKSLEAIIKPFRLKKSGASMDSVATEFGPETAESITPCSPIHKKRIPNLDGLRGLAILLVLFHHLPAIPENPFSTLQFNGRLGVSVFFTISGFLITTLFLREEQKNGRVKLASFYVRRSLRLFPLYYIALALETVAVLANAYSEDNRSLFFEKLPSYLFYYSNWHPQATQGPFFMAWSLAVEEQFYLVFGLIFAFVNRSLGLSFCLIAYVAKVLVYNFTQVGALYNELPWRIVFSYEEPILLGVMTAFIARDGLGLQLRRRVGAAVAWAFCVVTGILFFWPVTSKTSFVAQLFYVASAVLIGGLAVSMPNRILSGRILTYLGAVSYGIYLLHMLAFNSVKQLFESAFMIGTVGIPLAILLAGLSYRFIEQPFLKIKARFE